MKIWSANPIPGVTKRENTAPKKITALGFDRLVNRPCKNAPRVADGGAGASSSGSGDPPPERNWRAPARTADTPIQIRYAPPAICSADSTHGAAASRAPRPASVSTSHTTMPATMPAAAASPRARERVAMRTKHSRSGPGEQIAANQTLSSTR